MIAMRLHFWHAPYTMQRLDRHKIYWYSASGYARGIYFLGTVSDRRLLTRDPRRLSSRREGSRRSARRYGELPATWSWSFFVLRESCRNRRARLKFRTADWSVESFLYTNIMCHYKHNLRVFRSLIIVFYKYLFIFFKYLEHFHVIKLHENQKLDLFGIV